MDAITTGPRPRRRSLSPGKTVAFDPTREPPKSCMKQNDSNRSEAEQPPLKRGEITSTCFSESNKRKRTIHFNEAVSVREIRSSLSLCKGDHRILWLQDDEYASIKEHLHWLLSQVNSKGVSKTNGRKYCTRGLERLLNAKKDRKVDRMEAEEAVFREQTKQRLSGAFDDSRIAAAYLRRTRASVRRASDRGTEDAAVALPILHEGKEPTKPRSSSANAGSGNASTSTPSSSSRSKLKPSLLSAPPRRGSLSFLRKSVVFSRSM